MTTQEICAQMCWYFKQKKTRSTEPETIIKKNQHPSFADVMAAVLANLNVKTVRLENNQLKFETYNNTVTKKR